MANEREQLISVLKRERDEAIVKLDQLTQRDEEIDSLKQENRDLTEVNFFFFVEVFGF